VKELGIWLSVSMKAAVNIMKTNENEQIFSENEDQKRKKCGIREYSLLCNGSTEILLCENGD